MLQRNTDWTVTDREQGTGGAYLTQSGCLEGAAVNSSWLAWGVNSLAGFRHNDNVREPCYGRYGMLCGCTYNLYINHKRFPTLSAMDCGWSRVDSGAPPLPSKPDVCCATTQP